ncbi:MAG: TetR family transcriptional regulator [Thermoleophilia bacterium]|nr:TetR family transcriptional regulator [Thermoleophilia bacterium]
MAGESIAQSIGLRERKKQKTRAAIVEVALRLFVENGYQQTTIAKIAEAADVSPRTVSTYFPAKEAIVFDISFESKQRLADRIRSRPADQDTMDALSDWVLDEREIWNENEEQLSCQRQVIDRDEGLIAHERAQLREFEVLMAEGLAVDLGMEPGDLEPRMAAAAAVAVFDLLGDEHDSAKAEIPSRDDQLRILEQALTFVTGGVSAMREARSSAA